MSFAPALIIVDLQEDFCPPSGSLAVPNGRDIVGVANALLNLPFVLKVATKDWHPQDHISFASNHEPPNNVPYSTVITIRNPLNPQETQSSLLWPDHCVQSTFGAELIKELDQDKVDEVVKKGMDKRVEMYSAFADPFLRPAVANSGLAQLLRDKRITHCYVLGLAFDYCVKETAIHAVKEGFTTYIVADGTKAVDQSDEAVQKLKELLILSGVQIIDFAGPEVERVRHMS